ncbi:ATP synthase subunit e, mitochondrial isoform X1 [Mirounga leonina]|uniref:ATP synthase subunit e, mitochondrial isoform X1 n=1 Tax=Mirounga leonina TaxID=9715 RepID=UPI00156BFB10|nr:ATP synthase subunit e, mitochondrial isoform X1 [Mirounga leonina]
MLFHLRPPGGAVLLLFAADGACVRPCTLLRLRSFLGPCSVLLRLCFRREGYGQDGAAGAGLPAHQGYLKPRAEEERRIAAEEKKKQDERKRIERELAEAQDDSILK